MPVRIYDISKKLGLENKDVLAKAKELGITAAKVPSSSLDKITAEYLEDQLAPKKAAASPAPPVAPAEPEKIILVTAPPEPPPMEEAPQVAANAPDTAVEPETREVAAENGEVYVRSSGDREGGQLAVDSVVWGSFMRRIRNDNPIQAY